MKSIMILLLLTLILNANIACSQIKLKSKHPMEDYEKDINKTEVLTVTQQLTQLMIDRNTAAIDNIVDSLFTLTHITGYVQSKNEWFSEIETERMKYYSCKEVKTYIEINGDKATFIGQNMLDARIWGSRNNWRLQQTMQLEKRNGQWIIMKSVATTF